MPYAPGINYDFSPIAQGIQKFAGNIEDYVARGKKSKGLDAAIKAYAPADFDHTALAGMSLEEKEGFIRGHVLKQQAMESAAKMKEYQDQSALRQADLNQRQAADSRWSSFNDGMAADATLDSGPSLGMGMQAFAPDRLMQAGAKAGVLGDPRFTNLVRYAPEATGEAANPITFTEDPETGQRFAQAGRSILPSGSNPGRRSTDAQPIYDEHGNVLGHGIPGRNGMQILRPPEDNKSLRSGDRVALEKQKTDLVKSANSLVVTAPQRTQFMRRIEEIDRLLGNNPAQAEEPQSGGPTRTNIVQAFKNWRKK